MEKDTIIEKINRWIDRNRHLAGGKILCAGIAPECARHLARMIPEASVVCLEGAENISCPAGDANPAVNAGSMGPAGTEGAAGPNSKGKSRRLSTPLFLSGDLQNYDGGKFDTIFTLAASPLCPAEPDGSFPVWERGTLYLRRASLLMEYYEKEVHSLRKHLRPGGTLLSLVRGGHDEYFLGYCLAAAAEELAVDPSSIRQILCVENGKKQTLQGFTAHEGGRTEIGALLAENLNFTLDRMNTAAEELLGKQAEVMLQADVSGLLRGYHVYRGDQLMGKLAVYSSAQRPDVIYYFTDVTGDEPYLKRFHKSDLDKLIRHMVGEMHRQKAGDKSVGWKQLELQDDWSETEL